MSTITMFIDAPPHDVWATLADGWTYSNWVVGTSHIRAVDTHWPSAGSRLYHAVGAWPLVTRDETVVEEADPDRRLALTAAGTPFGHAIVSFDLAAEDAGCRVTMFEQPKAGPIRWVHNPLAERLLDRRNHETLARLRATVERHSSG
jgi:uncharacterized protein YndB with AHSA1/START domain